MARPQKTTTAPVKKRAAKKSKWTEVDHKQIIKNMQLLPPPQEIAFYQHESTHHVPSDKQLPLTPEPSMSEIDLLGIFCDNFNQYDDDAKDRVMAFLASKYRKHIPYNQKTN